VHQKSDYDRLTTLENRLETLESAVAQLILSCHEDHKHRRELEIANAEKERDLILKITRRLDS
jgi:hypothetical protein